MIEDKYIEEMRAKLESLWEKMSLEDYKRLHAKFFGCILSVEQGFQKHYPKEWEEYKKEFYGDD